MFNFPEDDPTTVTLNKIIIRDEANASIAFAAERMAIAVRQLTDEKGLKLFFQLEPLNRYRDAIIFSMQELIGHRIYEKDSKNV